MSDCGCSARRECPARRSVRIDTGGTIGSVDSCPSLAYYRRERACTQSVIFALATNALVVRKISNTKPPIYSRTIFLQSCRAERIRTQPVAAAFYATNLSLGLAA